MSGDWFWASPELEQARNQLHRIGHESAVTSWLLLSEMSIDQHAHRVLPKKRDVSHAGTEEEAEWSYMAELARHLRQAIEHAVSC